MPILRTARAPSIPNVADHPPVKAERLKLRETDRRVEENRRAIERDEAVARHVTTLDARAAALLDDTEDQPAVAVALAPLYDEREVLHAAQKMQRERVHAAERAAAGELGVRFRREQWDAVLRDAVVAQVAACRLWSQLDALSLAGEQAGLEWPHAFSHKFRLDLPVGDHSMTRAFLEDLRERCGVEVEGL